MKGKKLKVLMTTDTSSGVWNYTLELCNALKKYGVQVHLVAMGGWPSPFQQIKAEKMSNVLLYKSDFKMEWTEDSQDDLEASKKWINSIYHTVQPDILHLNNYAHVDENWNVPVITAFHTGVQTWWQAVKGKETPTNWSQYLDTVKQSLETSDLKGTPPAEVLKKIRNRKRVASHA